MGVTDRDAYFFVTVTNAVLNPAGVIEINGASFGVVPYYELQTRWVNGTMSAEENFPKLKLNPPTDEELAAGVVQLTSLKITFDAFAILKGELLGTNTGCVRGNDVGALGEYRNGALVVQAINAKNFSGFVYDAPTNTYIAAKTVLDGTHLFAVEVPSRTTPMFWESSVFWHWDGDCYGEDGWEEEWEACFVDLTQVCWEPDEKAEKKAKKKKKGDKDEKGDPPEEGDPPEPPADPEHILESVTTADGSAAGRLFWRELIPDD
jgi:hypothetical protein